MNIFYCIIFIFCHVTKCLSAQLDEAYLNLAHACLEAGNHQEALIYFQKTIECEPSNSQALLSYGIALFRAQKYEEAQAIFEKQLILNPLCARTYLQLGNLHYAQKKFTHASQYYERSILCQENNAPAYFVLGNIYQQQGDYYRATIMYRRGLDYDSSHIPMRSQLMLLLREQENFQEALIECEKILSLQPNNLTYLQEKGRILTSLKRFDDALTCYNQLIIQAPENNELLTSIAKLHFLNNNLKEAFELYEIAQNREPNNNSICLQMAHAYCACGNYAKGFEYFDKTNSLETNSRNMIPLEHLSDATVLIQGEWLHEDMIQFLRYVPYVKKYAAFIIVQAPQALKLLLMQCPYIDKVITIEHPELCCFDRKISLTSLPHLFTSQLKETIPCPIPYLFACPKLSNYWKQKLISDQKKIGIYFRTNSLEKYPLRELFSLLASYNPDLYILNLKQKNLLHQNFSKTMLIHQFGEQFDETMQDLQELTAIMDNLDLIITDDCTATHIAGALGKQICLLLENKRYWRWTTNEKISHWYPTIHIFWQDQQGKWENALNEMQVFLNNLKIPARL